MRVLHLACVAPPEIGGIGQVAYDEVMGLRARGVEALLVSAGQNEHVPSQEGVLRLPSSLRVGNAAMVRGLKKELEAADIVHLHYPWYGVMERVLWFFPKKPVIVTFHMDATASDWRGWVFWLHRRLLQARLLRHARKILVSSRDYALQSSLKDLLPGIEDRLVELPFGIDTDFFSPARDGRPIIEDGRSTVLFVGGLDRAHSFKGLSVLLEAMTHVSLKVHLQIVGDGDERASFQKQVQDLGLGARVHFFGRVDRGALLNQYRQADVLAFPSVSAAEAFGLVAVEAQACGVPVVASRLPGVRTVVLDGETGILVEPGDVSSLACALERVLTDVDLRRNLGVGARRHVLARYSHEMHIQRLCEIYQSV